MKQIIVTKKGQGIIPRALANGESIKFTRVCISDKDYTGVELCDLESIESVKQEVNVDNVHIINDTQVEVICGVDNEKLNDAYYIKTIGIYAEDIDGNEILYGMSVSEDVPKYMPKYEGKTLTGILYRLTINIDNADNVITNVNNATVANVLEVQLIEKRVSEVENRVKKIEKDVTQFSNPNILINSNFKKSELVNQRGQSVYNGKGYTVDMWRVYNDVNENTSLTVEDECIKLMSTGVAPDAFTDFRQPIENYRFYEGKTVTVTIDYEASSGSKFAFWANTFNEEPTQNSTGIITGNGIRKKVNYTYVFNGNSILHMFVIRLLRNETNKVGDYIKLYSIKIELGEVATPFIDDDPATKLAKCHRYLQVFRQENSCRAFSMSNIIGSGIYFAVELFTTMRTIPSISSSKPPVVYIGSGSVAGFTISFTDKYRHSFKIVAVKSNHGLTAMDTPIALMDNPSYPSGVEIIASAEL